MSEDEQPTPDTLTVQLSILADDLLNGGRWYAAANDRLLAVDEAVIQTKELPLVRLRCTSLGGHTWHHHGNGHHLTWQYGEVRTVHLDIAWALIAAHEDKFEVVD